MAGTCIATVKVIGATSLGLLTASLSYQSIKLVPGFINDLTYKLSNLSSDYLDSVKNSIKKSRAVNLSLGALATSLFSLAFKYSPPAERHPYLLYSAIGAPIAFFAVVYNGFKFEERLLKKSTQVAEIKNEQSPAVPISSNDDESCSQLGKSYIHVSDEESSSTVSTPVASTPSTPKLKENLTIEEEVESSLIKKEVVYDLIQIKRSYVTGLVISATASVISLIGLFGDYFLL